MSKTKQKWWKPSENLVNFWNFTYNINLVKTCSKLGEIHQTWWKLGEFHKRSENLVKYINLVKNWWNTGENLVETW